MTIWSRLAGLQGYYTSPPLPILLQADGSITKADWTASVPTATKLVVQTNVSLDGGFDWLGWKSLVNGGSIPDLDDFTPLNHAFLKYRVLAESASTEVTPMFTRVSFTFIPILHFHNEGDIRLRPEIWITKIGHGPFSIVNTSDGNREFAFTDLADGETVYVNGDREYIESSLALTYRYDRFNDQYLELPTGTNRLQINGEARVRFRYQYKLL